MIVQRLGVRNQGSESAVHEEETAALVVREELDRQPAVYVCERFACRAPATDPEGLAAA